MPPDEARVSVVIPTYNRGAMVERALASVLEQDGVGEVIVVDDGSTDDTPERMRAFGERIVYERTANRERGAARNRGAALARFPFVSFLDSDDRILPGHLRGALDAFAAHPDAAFVYSDVIAEEKSGKVAFRVLGARPRGFRGGPPVTSLIAEFNNANLAQGGTIYRKDVFLALGGFREDRALAGSEDWELHVRMLADHVAYPTHRATFVYLIHEGNTFANAKQVERCMDTAVRFVEENVELRARYGALFPRMRAIASMCIANAFLNAGDRASFRRWYVAGLRSAPALLFTETFAQTSARALLGPGVLRALKRVSRLRPRGTQA